MGDHKEDVAQPLEASSSNQVHGPPLPMYHHHVMTVPWCPPPDAVPASGTVYRRNKDDDDWKTYAEREMARRAV
jgi:hypothetical protein